MIRFFYFRMISKLRSSVRFEKNRFAGGERPSLSRMSTKRQSPPSVSCDARTRLYLRQSTSASTSRTRRTVATIGTAMLASRSRPTVKVDFDDASLRRSTRDEMSNVVDGNVDIKIDEINRIAPDNDDSGQF